MSSKPKTKKVVIQPKKTPTKPPTKIGPNSNTHQQQKGEQIGRDNGHDSDSEEDDLESPFEGESSSVQLPPVTPLHTDHEMPAWFKMYQQDNLKTMKTLQAEIRSLQTQIQSPFAQPLPTPSQQETIQEGIEEEDEPSDDEAEQLKDEDFHPTNGKVTAIPASARNSIEGMRAQFGLPKPTQQDLENNVWECEATKMTFYHDEVFDRCFYLLICLREGNVRAALEMVQSMILIGKMDAHLATSPYPGSGSWKKFNKHARTTLLSRALLGISVGNDVNRETIRKLDETMKTVNTLFPKTRGKKKYESSSSSTTDTDNSNTSSKKGQSKSSTNNSQNPK